MKTIIAFSTIAITLLVSSCQTHPEYGSQQGLVKQAELYGQIYKEEGDAYAGGDLKTYYACQRLLQTMNRSATEQYGAKWQASRDHEIKRIDALHAEHPE
jgi:hypothetical protein